MAAASGTSGTVDENLQVKQTCCSVKHMWLHCSAYVLHCTAYQVSCTEYVYTCYTVQHTCYTVQHMCYTVQHTNLQPTCSSHILPITPDGTHCPPPPFPPHCPSTHHCLCPQLFHLTICMSSVAMFALQKLREEVLIACINCLNGDQQDLHHQLLPVRYTTHCSQCTAGYSSCALANWSAEPTQDRTVHSQDHLSCCFVRPRKAWAHFGIISSISISEAWRRLLFFSTAVLNIQVTYAACRVSITAAH